MKNLGYNRPVAILLTAFALVLGGASIGLADETVYTTASRQDPFDSSGASARAVGIGTAFVGVADDSSAVLWNPAGLAGLRGSEVAAHHLSGIAGITHDVLTMAMPVKDRFGLGLYGHYVNYGQFEARQEDGRTAGSLHANQLGLGVGGGIRLIEGLYAGASFRGTQQTFGEYSQALFNADTGLLLSTENGWRLGTSYNNLGVSTKSASSATAFRIGVSRVVPVGADFALLAAASGSIEPKIGNGLSLGAEGAFHRSYFLRLGYRLRLRETGLEGFSGLTAGAGLAMRSVRLDYAYEPFGDIGNTHRVSLVYGFGYLKSAPTAMRASPQGLTVPVPVTIYQPMPAPPVAVPPAPETAKPAAGQVVPEPVAVGGPEDALTVRFELPADGVEKAQEFEKQGRTQEAFQVYLSAVQKDKDDAAAWRGLGNLYYRHGMKEQAIRCIEEVIRLRPQEKALAEWLKGYKAQPVPSPKP